MACENLRKYNPIVINFQGTFLYMRTRAQLILDPIGQAVKRDTDRKWDTGHYKLDCSSVYVGQNLTGC